MPSGHSTSRPHPPSTSAAVTVDSRRRARLRSLHAGPLREDVPLVESGQVLGRDGERVDLIQARPGTSRRHAWIGQDDQGAWVLRDLDSRNGSFVNGERVDKSRRLRSGDVIGLGRERVPDYEFVLHADGSERRLTLAGSGPWTLGRGLDQAVSLPADLSVSQRHARLERRGERLRIVDRGSRNGLWQGQARRRRFDLAAGESVVVGHHRLRWQAKDAGAIELQLSSFGQAVGLRLEEWRLQGQADAGAIELAPGQLHRLCLNGRRDRDRLMRSLGRDGPIDGRCFSQDWLAEQVERQRDRVALIDDRESMPEDTILGQWLREEARLRNGSDLSEAECDALIATTLEALGLQHRRDQRIRALSALERALARLAAGLLTRPGLVVIDTGDLDLEASARRDGIERLERLAGPELTLVLVGPRAGLPMKRRPSTEGTASKGGGSSTNARAIRPPLRRPSARVVSCLLRRAWRALRQQPGTLVGLVAIPVCLILTLGLWLSIQSALLAAQITLLISTPLAALALAPGRSVAARTLLQRFGLLPDLAIAQALLAAVAVALQFLLVTALAIALLPPMVWSVPVGMQLLLTGAAGVSLGMLMVIASRGHGQVALVLVTLAATCQAVWVIKLQPGLLTLGALTLVWSVLMLVLEARRPVRPVSLRRRRR
jgi:pSer/pThr/pTyr-binding forkhead associated (FHA) protein